MNPKFLPFLTFPFRKTLFAKCSQPPLFPYDDFFLDQVLRETINTEAILQFFFFLQLLVSLTCNDCRTPVRPRWIEHLNWTESAHVKPLILLNTVVLILIWNLPYEKNLHWTQGFNLSMKFIVRSKLTVDSGFNPYMKFTVRSKLALDSGF